ncbi:MAG: hypothetical protein M1832_000576 [Thelocarpon impressellum]|nr:MAG: hypothetical protein M1832_000576 [Thelocarpon impressellum]
MLFANIRQRLKGALDSRIAEEQARQQKAAGASTTTAPGTAPGKVSRANSGVKRADSLTSSSSRQGRGRERVSVEEDDSREKGPDPVEFETAVPEFLLDSDDGSSRAATPGPDGPRSEKEQGAAAAAAVDGSADVTRERSPLAAAEGSRAVSQSRAFVGSKQTAAELPTDVRVKLRKLDKLEGRYQELLRNYRIAHARVTSIETFETSLRENTPLTSIGDPGALVEYLQQLSLKSDMVMDELKRVTTDRDEYKKKAEAAESTIKTSEDKTATLASPTTPDVTPSTGMRQGAEETQTKEESEDFFSYEEELPRLESELQERNAEIVVLKKEVKTLKGDLAVTRESTEGMAESLEAATRELTTLRDANEVKGQQTQAAAKKEVDLVMTKLRLAEEELSSLKVQHEEQQKRSAAESKQRQEEVVHLKTEMSRLQSAISAQGPRVSILTQLVDSLQTELQEVEGEKARLTSEAAARTRKMSEVEETARRLKTELETVTAKAMAMANGTDISVTLSDNQELDPAMTNPAAASKSKKNKRKKRKGGKTATTPGNASPELESSAVFDAAETVVNGVGTPAQVSGVVEALEKELQSLRKTLEEREAQLQRLQQKRDTEELKEEVESLKDDLVLVGQDHVVAKEKIKALVAEKTTLEESAKALETEIVQLRSTQSSSASAASELGELKAKATSLQKELSAAQQLAAARFKDLTEVKEVLQKAQPELVSLRAEVSGLKGVKDELSAKMAEVKKLEGREKDLRAEMSDLRKQASQRGAEIVALKQKVAEETRGRVRAEEARNTSEKELRKVEGERKASVDAQSTTSKDLARAKAEANGLRAKARDLEEQASKLARDGEGLREEIQLKTAQYASAESLMASMRDQTAEMGVQMREVREQSESLLEELSDAHRLLSERSREGETMRRLLAEVEGRAESKVREMRSQMELAIEERDRAEEEASTIGRRRARELDDAKGKVRETERSLKRADEAREDLERAEKDWKTKRQDLETRAAQAMKELGEVRQAMSELQDALDANERQMREADKQKAELRRTVDETQGRLEKLQKANKTMAEEMRSLRTAKTRALDTDASSSRSSVDSGLPPSKQKAVALPLRKSSLGPADAKTNSGSGGEMDYVYLKNVLLQFLEQRDKRHQKQLIPVLAMLLHFDGTDEQKWMAAISTK